MTRCGESNRQGASRIPSGTYGSRRQVSAIPQGVDVRSRSGQGPPSASRCPIPISAEPSSNAGLARNPRQERSTGRLQHDNRTQPLTTHTRGRSGRCRHETETIPENRSTCSKTPTARSDVEQDGRGREHIPQVTQTSEAHPKHVRPSQRGDRVIGPTSLP